MDVRTNFLENILALFAQYKKQGDRALAQLSDADLSWRPNSASNSAELIVHHMSGNMVSRFTDFLTTDGEKPWRKRDDEFAVGFESRAEMIGAWEKGWLALFNTLGNLGLDDLGRVVYIRKEPHTVLEALQRQLTHVATHIGQLIYIGKALRGDAWENLSIPKKKDGGNLEI